MLDDKTTHELDPAELVRILNDQAVEELLDGRKRRERAPAGGRSTTLPVIAAGIGGCHLCTPDRQCSLCAHNAVPL